MPKTVWLTDKEFALLCESRDLFMRFTGTKRISWGAFLCALALGAVAAKALTGILVRCPDCGSEVNMELHNATAKRFRARPELSCSQVLAQARPLPNSGSRNRNP